MSQQATMEDGDAAPGGHLLSLFPLDDLQGFARLSCIALSEAVTPCQAPFCTSQEGLCELLLSFLPQDRVNAILRDLDNKVEVRFEINDAEARAIGFLAKVV